MVQHIQIILEAKQRGFHIITDEIKSQLPDIKGDAILNLHILHTSAGLCMNENADPDVLHDFELYFNKLAPEFIQGMKHTIEGPDDMPAHIKSVMTGHNLIIPILNGKLVLGTWQGIYLCEFRNSPRQRKLLATVMQ